MINLRIPSKPYKKSFTVEAVFLLVYIERAYKTEMLSVPKSLVEMIYRGSTNEIHDLF